MIESTPEAKMISFDEAGFTGPQLLDEQQPYFVYASHDLDEDECEGLISSIRSRYRVQGDELKSKRLKRRAIWDSLVEDICNATNGRAKVVTYNKKMALAGKFFEYFFEPVLSDNSQLFYGIDFHRYMMNTIYLLIQDKSQDYGVVAAQMQAFMRSFDPRNAPDIVGGEGNYLIEMQRIIQFCRGYLTVITDKTAVLRPEVNETGKWTLDLTTTALFSLLFHGWGHRHPRLQLLCDSSKPLAAGSDLFNSWVGKEHSTQISDGKSLLEIRGNLVNPVQFGSSESHLTLQVADLLAGMTLDVCVRGSEAPNCARVWVDRHLMHKHSIDYESKFSQKSNGVVRVGREVLKELARRAESRLDPLDRMDEFIEKMTRRF